MDYPYNVVDVANKIFPFQMPGMEIVSRKGAGCVGKAEKPMEGGHQRCRQGAVHQGNHTGESQQAGLVRSIACHH